MSFSSMMNDSITLLKSDGQELGPIKASVQKNKIFVMSSKYLFETGDLIQRKMSNGGVETYRVIDPGFYESTMGIQAHYQMDVEKLGLPEAKKAVQSITYNISITGNNSRFNQNSFDNSVNEVVQISNSINEYLSKLRNVIQKLELPENKKQEYFGVIDTVEVQALSSTPNRTIISALLSSLPTVESISTIASNIMSLIKG